MSASGRRAPSTTTTTTTTASTTTADSPASPGLAPLPAADEPAPTEGVLAWVTEWALSTGQTAMVAAVTRSQHNFFAMGLPAARGMLGTVHSIINSHDARYYMQAAYLLQALVEMPEVATDIRRHSAFLRLFARALVSLKTWAVLFVLSCNAHEAAALLLDQLFAEEEEEDDDEGRSRQAAAPSQHPDSSPLLLPPVREEHVHRRAELARLLQEAAEHDNAAEAAAASSLARPRNARTHVHHFIERLDRYLGSTKLEKVYAPIRPDASLPSPLLTSPALASSFALPGLDCTPCAACWPCGVPGCRRR